MALSSPKFPGQDQGAIADIKKEEVDDEVVPIWVEGTEQDIYNVTREGSFIEVDIRTEDQSLY